MGLQSQIIGMFVVDVDKPGWVTADKNQNFKNPRHASNTKCKNVTSYI